MNLSVLFCVILFLCSAILRPGRLDLHISVDKPDLQGREKIFKQYLSKVKRDSSKSY